MNFIDDPRKWRLSRSGYAIVTGWSNERTIIATVHGGPMAEPEDLEAFIKNAERICELYNATLPTKDAP